MSLILRVKSDCGGWVSFRTMLAFDSMPPEPKTSVKFILRRDSYESLIRFKKYLFAVCWRRNYLFWGKPWSINHIATKLELFVVLMLHNRSANDNSSLSILIQQKTRASQNLQPIQNDTTAYIFLRQRNKNALIVIVAPLWAIRLTAAIAVFSSFKIRGVTNLTERQIAKQ